MNEKLVHIVKIAAAGLEAEDRTIKLAMTGNRHAGKGRVGGVLEINNERYYQFVVARTLLFSLPYRVAVEWGSHDLVLLEPENNQLAVTIEMKRWMSSVGRKELPSIRRDIDEKLAKVKAGLRLMLVFSACPVGESDRQLAWLGEQVGVGRQSWALEAFETIDTSGNCAEFFVAGAEIASVQEQT